MDELNNEVNEVKPVKTEYIAVDTYEVPDSVSADEAAMAEDNNLLIGVGIGALGVLAGSFLWKKALKPGLKKGVNFLQSKLNKVDEAEAESGEEKPPVVDGEIVNESADDSKAK